MGGIGESWAPLRPKLLPKSLVVPSGAPLRKSSCTVRSEAVYAGQLKPMERLHASSIA
jgi:hypothetical protein